MRLLTIPMIFTCMLIPAQTFASDSAVTKVRVTGRVLSQKEAALNRAFTLTPSQRHDSSPAIVRMVPARSKSSSSTQVAGFTLAGAADVHYAVAVHAARRPGNIFARTGSASEFRRGVLLDGRDDVAIFDRRAVDVRIIYE